MYATYGFFARHGLNENSSLKMLPEVLAGANENLEKNNFKDRETVSQLLYILVYIRLHFLYTTLTFSTSYKHWCRDAPSSAVTGLAPPLTSLHAAAHRHASSRVTPHRSPSPPSAISSRW